MAPLSPDEARRYGRHLLLPEVGARGQERLRASRVLVVGAGGLGSPVALYLAAAGVGRLTLVDDDEVDASNLQRQVLFDTADVGRPKVDAAADRLRALNPGVEVDARRERFARDNALGLVAAHDVVVDCSDNFPTRYLANDAAALTGRPDVYASVHRFDGQAAVFWPTRVDTGRVVATPHPCYRCLHPRPPPPGLVPSCAEAGVLGVLPGMLGAVQATETLKILLGVGDPLVGKLLLVDALSMETTTLHVPKDPACALCGASPTVTQLVDTEASCDVPAAGTADEIAATELAARLQGADAPVVLDVREAPERAFARIEPSRHVPLRELPARAAEVPLDRDVVVVCRSGARSAEAVRFLRSLGHRRVRNLRGGILAWEEEVGAVPASR